MQWKKSGCLEVSSCQSHLYCFHSWDSLQSDVHIHGFFHTKMMQSICFGGNIQGTPEFTIFSFSDIKVSGFSHCETPVSCQQSPCFPCFVQHGLIYCHTSLWKNFRPSPVWCSLHPSPLPCLGIKIVPWRDYVAKFGMLHDLTNRIIYQFSKSICVVCEFNCLVWEHGANMCAGLYMIGAHN